MHPVSATVHVVLPACPSVYCQARPDLNRRNAGSVRSLPKRMMHSPTVFPGEDAPGTGTLLFPPHVPTRQVLPQV